jgi:hypothetical protein
MIPQYSSPAQAGLRWRDGLQARFCTQYSIMHYKAFNKSGLRQCSSPGTGFLFDKIGSWITDAPIDDPSNLYPVLKVMRVTLQNDSSGCRSASKQCTPPDKQRIFNRMTGSPGDPPDNRMHKFKPKRITPFIHRLVSDPTGMEAGWETLT